MKQILKWTSLLLFAGAVGLGMSFIFTAGIQVQSPAGVAQRLTIQATLYPSGNSRTSYAPAGVYAPTQPVSTYGPGMMGGWRSGTPDYSTTGVYTPTQLLSYSGYGPGMMSHGVGGMMGRNYRAGGWNYLGSGAPMTIDEAVSAANQYLLAYSDPDSGQSLILTEMMEFSENFYAEVREESTGVHAFELLIDRYTGVVSPEPGPNMMWNTKYGHMGGMMGDLGGQQTGPMSVTSEQARDLAQQWLNASLPGTTTAEKADEFFGYYTIHVLKGDQTYGMLSVNGFTGEVWYHTWHGDFIDMKKLEE